MSREDEIGRLMTKCISCGKCTPYCPSSALGGLDPHELMVSGEGDVEECIQCGNCSRICRRSDPFRVIRMMLSDGLVIPVTESSLTEGCDVAIVPGCTVRERIPELADSTVSALSSLGYRCGVLQGEVCCLRPAKYSLLSDMERRTSVRKSLSPAAGKRVVTPCPECAQEFGGEAENLLDVLMENIEKLPRSGIPMKVTVYTGCALSSRKKDVSSLVSAMGLDVAFVSTGCCGRDSGWSEPLEERLRESHGSVYAVTFCPRCTVNYSGKVPVLHISQLVDRLSVGSLENVGAYDCPYGQRPASKDRTRW